MAMRKVSHRRDIFPVFRELFAKGGVRRRHDMTDEATIAKKRRTRIVASPAPASSTCCSAAPDWNFEMLGRVFDAVRQVGDGEMGLDPYRTQIEVITSEQMLDAYSSVGMPLFYRHWSFGKHFARNEALYRKGYQGLAYEIVINSDPCIVYIMEENSATMQTLVMAHAAMGHNHFFKNNYLFKQWTDANGIAGLSRPSRKSFIAKCEERYGVEAVERADRCARTRCKATASIAIRASARWICARKQLREQDAGARMARQLFNDLWRTVPQGKGKKPATNDD